VSRANQKVKEAIESSLEHMEDYFRGTVASHNKGGRGSLWTEDVSVDDLLDADWEEQHHPDIKTGVTGYVTYDFDGIVGIVEISELGEDDVVILADPKETGKAQAHWVASYDDRDETDETWILIGEYEGNVVVWTVHPGKPINPSRVPADEVLDDDSGPVHITPDEAEELGLEYAKIIESEDEV
jgi:hypothetical protein